MHQYTRIKLELDKIIKKVLRYTATSMGREIINRMEPVADKRYLEEKLREVTAAVELLETFGRLPLGGISDLRDDLKQASRGMVLSIEDIMKVKNTIRGTGEVRQYFRKVIEESDPAVVEKRYSIISNKGQQINKLFELQHEIEGCVNQQGEIKDNASPELKSIRNRIRSLESRIRSKLDSITRDNRYQDMLQEQLVTRRENRYVVPVKHEHRNTFKGIIHDRSASGMTLFMEPMAVVELNNELREVKNEEEREIYKILQQLTAGIASFSEEIRENLKIATFFDVVFAKAAYSREIEGIAPELNKNGYTELKQARHPLLQEEPVPIDLEVGGEFNSLVITGPNTGGKTVSLKTVGLFVLMTEMGFHIPAARGTVISLYEKVFADIGDEQSIEQNLSTFSSHMNKIRTYLKRADEGTLVLLDELGAGTDPREGAALGIAILEKLKKNNVTTIATTHYSQLKSYAYSTSGVENASVEFDLDTLSPTYKLIMGIPGGSNAFEIALRLGLPEEIISEAEKLIDKEDLQVEEIIKDLNDQRNKFRDLKQKNQKTNRQLQALKEDYEKKLKRLEERKGNILAEARDEAEKVIKKARKKTDAILSDLKKQDFAVRSQVDRKGTEIKEEIDTLEEKIGDEYQEEKSKEGPKELKPGDRVRVRSLGKKGRVLEVDWEKDEVKIQAGVMEVTAKIKDLVKVELDEIEKKEMVKKYRVSKASNVQPKLDLRGSRYDEAQRQLDKYLDDALLAGYSEVELIHGKGTGALREAVTEKLEEHPHVSSFRLGKQKEGGMGVTIATLKKSK